MIKSLKTSNLLGRNATRSLLAVSLSMSLAALGCTTDRTLGNGDPVTTPGLRTSPTSSPSTGSESAPSVPDSMTSSSFHQAQALPTVKPRRANTNRSKVRLSADEAAAVMAQNQPRVRYLGVAYPGGQQSGLGQSATGYRTGQFRNPALVTNPQITINSSISSAPTPAIASGAGADGGAGGGGVAGAVVVGGTGTNAGLSLGGNATSAPLIAAPTTASLSPLGASPGAALPLGSTGFGVTPTTAPTAFSSRNPDPTVSSFPALAATRGAQLANTNSGNGVLGTPATNGLTANSTNAAGSNRASATASRSTANAVNATRATTTTSATPVVVTRSATGRVVISNVTSNNQ